MDSSWRNRLGEAIRKSGRSERNISLGAGLGPGYLNGILRDGKDPSVSRLAAVCREIGVPLTYILIGVEIDQEAEKILQIIAKDDVRKAALLRLLESAAAV